MNSTTQAHERTLFGHPIGLYILFFTEMWERFSYYGMRAILVLYLTSLTTDKNSGLGWSSDNALALYGWYTMLVYVMSIPGGMIADKWLGQKKSVLIGGILLVFGHGILVITDMWAFYSGLALIVLGVGMLKPNISTMVGGLYKAGDIRRDKGFTIFYIGINMGAFLSSLIVGTIGEFYGWHYGFGLAGIGMLFGLLVYVFGQKYLSQVGNKANTNNTADEVSILKLFIGLFSSPLQLAIFIILIITSIFLGYRMEGNDRWAYGLLFLFLSIVTGLMMMIYKDLKDRTEKDRFIVALLSLLLVIVFWGAFEQAGGLMNIYANEKTNRLLMGFTVPATWFQSLNPLYIIIFGTFVAGYWTNRKLKGKQSSSIFKMAVGVIIMGLGFVFMSFATLQFEKHGQSAMFWLIFAYLFHTIGELCSSPVALSFITKLSPVKYGSLMMGVYFAATGLGNKVSGILGESASSKGELSVFTSITVFTVIFGLIVIGLVKPLKRLTHGVEDNEK